MSESDLFAGRKAQLNKVIDAANQRGQHAIVYGERGVGKTSLARVLSSRIRTASGVPPQREAPTSDGHRTSLNCTAKPRPRESSGANVVAPMINCHSVQTYAGIWREMFSQIEILESRSRPGFQRGTDQVPGPDLLPANDDHITPGVVCAALAKVASFQQDQGVPTLVILDEFDRTPNGLFKRTVADTIKTLSDRATPVTIVIVGVADTVGDLISEHQSIERAITQVHMPRMQIEETNEIIGKGLAKLGMRIAPKAKERVASLSQGLPSYTHRLSLHAAREAITARRVTIQPDDVRQAVREVVLDTGQSLRDEHRKAVTSTRAVNLFEQVIVACACAKTDQFGFFGTGDVRAPMSDIMGRQVDIPSFARHLKQFCEEHRGPILRQVGVKRRYRYRFANPLMQPFVIMNGIVGDLLNEDAAILRGSGVREGARR